MANLETLELTINANAQSASQGLRTLINSLSALSTALIKPYSDLRDFNAELRTLKSNANIKFTGLEKSAAKIKASVAKASTLVQEADIGNRHTVNRAAADATPYDQWKKEHDQMHAEWVRKNEEMAKLPRPSEAFYRGKPVIRDADVREVSAEEAEAMRNVQEETQAAGEAQKTFGERMKESIANLKEALPRFQLLSKTLRIASTMLLRMGLRALFKGIKEGYNNYYQYAKLIGNTFSKDMDTVYSKWGQLKNQMGASLASVVSAAIPVFNALANAAVGAFNSISQLLALLSGKSTWSRATEQVNNYSDAINSASGGGGKLKEMLAQFDELNVIASESGGGGGGNGAASDYAEMFEESYEFNQQIRDIVDFIKSNFESIKGIAIAIGTAILSWKLAEAFLETIPLLSNLFALVSTGAVIAITAQVTWMLTNEYLESGDIGWLIADVFTTAVGSTAAWQIAKHFIGGNAGAWAAAITLTFSAIAGITALLQHTDVSALSKESLITAVENALKVGAAGAILLKTVGGATTQTALAGGAAYALVTFGVIIGLKAAFDPNIELFSLDSLKAALLSAATLGFGLKLITGSWMVSGGSALIAIGGYIGLKAILSENIELFSVESIVAALASAVAIGLGAKLIGATWAVSGGAALLSLGGYIAIKAIMDQSVEVASLESVTAGIVSSVAVALGVVAVGGGWAIAGAAALATFIAYFAVKALVSIGKNDIEWGTVDLTNEEVQQFVNQKMFKVNVTTSIERINTLIDRTAVDKSKLESDLADLIGDMNVIRLGIASLDGEFYNNLKAKVDSIVDSASTYAKDAKNMAKLTLEFTPTLVGDTDDEQGSWFEHYTEGWGVVEEFYRTKGKEIGDLLVKAEKGQITASESEILDALLQQISDVTAAITQAGINSSAFADLNIGLGDITEASFSDVMTLYKEYKENLNIEYEKLVKEQYAKQGELVAALFKINPESDEYKQALADYEAMGERIPQAIKDGVDSASEPGRNLLKEWIEEHFDPGSVSVSWTDEYVREWLNAEGLLNTLEEVFSDNGFDMNVIDINDLLEVGGWDLLNKDLQTKILNNLTLDAETVNALKKNLKMDATSIFSISNWNSLTLNAKMNFVNAMIDAFGAEEALAAAKKCGIDIDKAVKEGISNGSPDVKKTAEEVKKKIDDAIGGTTAQKNTKSWAGKIVESINAGISNAKTTLSNNFKTWQTILKGNLTTSDVKTPKYFGASVKDNAEKVIATTKKTVQGTLTTSDVKTPAKFGDAAKKSASNTYKALKTAVQGNLLIKNITAPSKFGQEVKNNAATAFKKINGAVTGTLQTKNITTPGKFGEGAKNNASAAFKKIKGVVTGVLQTKNITVPDKFGEKAKGSAATAYKNIKGKIDVPLQTKDITTPKSYGSNANTATKKQMDAITTKVSKEEAIQDLKTPYLFGSTANKDVAGKMEEIHSLVGDTVLTTADVGTPKDMGVNAKNNIWDDVMTPIYYEVAGVALTTQDVSIPANAGDTAKKAVSEVMGGIYEVIGDGVKIPIGVQSDGSSVEIVQSGGLGGGGGLKVTALTKAEGDINIRKGSLFIAGEAGPELVGTIGGHTAVANQKQIIEGIASGVQAANSEQNALLRQQNSLLRAILEKDSSVRIGASAALGRVAKQSLDMYGTLVGG